MSELKLELTVCCSEKYCPCAESIDINPQAMGPVHLTVRQAMRSRGWLPKLALSSEKGGQHWEYKCTSCVRAEMAERLESEVLA